MKIHPWQEKILVDIESGGLKPGEMYVMMSGRNVGKSAFSSQALKRLFDDLYSQPISDILLSEGKIYGARYYTAEPIGGNWREMETWCTSTFGPGCRALWGEIAPEPSQRWYMNNRKFWFRSEADRTMFVLKWR